MQSAFLGYRLGHRVFPGNICISLNDEIVHGIGSQRRIQYGDIVKLDIGVVQDGWVGDTASTVPVGMIDERTERLLRVTENALAARDRDRASEGVRLGDVCAAIEEEAVRNQFQRRARICRARRGAETARRAAGPELRQARERPAIKGRNDPGDRTDD